MGTFTFRGCRKVLSRMLFRLLADRSLPSSEASTQQHIVIPRWDAKLGDAIVSSFFLREAAKMGIQVTVITVEELVPLHRQAFGVNRVMTVSANPGVRELIRIVRQLGRVDAVVHLVERLQPPEILFIRMLRPARLYSLDDNLRCVNRKLGIATVGLNVVERYRRVLNDLGALTVNTDYIVPLPDELPAPEMAPQILFNPWASREDKSLSMSCATITLRAIAAAFPNHQVGILYGPASRELANKLETNVACINVKCVSNITTPADVAGYLCRAQVVISIDTAIVHMAVGLNKRLIAIYPTPPGVTNPWLPPSSSLTKVIFSPQCVLTTKKGKKEMNNFSLSLLIEALQERVIPTSYRTEHLTLCAQIIPGLGVATGTLARQLPLIAQDFPEVADCFPGTLNLKLELPLEITRPDHRTHPLAWTPSGKTREVFDLLRIELELPHFPAPVPAWLYVAHRSPHRATPTLHEVIAPWLAIGDISQCLIHLPSRSIGLVADVHQANFSISRSLSANQ